MTACVVCAHHGRTRIARYEHHTCGPCQDRLRALLRDVERYWCLLTPVRQKRGSERVSGPGYGSRSPADDTTITLTDPRSCWTLEDGPPPHGSLTGWATAVHTDHGYTGRLPTTVPGLVDWLIRELDWITRQSWVEDLAVELADMLVHLRVQAGDPPARVIARCIELRPDGTYCGTPLYEPEPTPGDSDVTITCPRCRRRYAGRDLVILRLVNEQEAS